MYSLNNKKILVTGIDGFSGSIIYKFLKEKNFKCLGVSRKLKRKNILKWDLTNNYLEKKKFEIDWIVHIASIHKITEFKRNGQKNKNKNILMTKNLIRFAKKYDIKNIIFFSTIDLSYNKILGEKKNYNLSKLISEKKLLENYEKNFFKKLVILRVPAILGKNANENFFVTLIKKLKKNKEIFVEDRLKYNNFVHINDLCFLILKIIRFSRIKNEKKKYMTIINCLSSQYIHLLSKVEILKKKLKSKSNLNLIKSRASYKFLKAKKNIFHFKFMSCNQAINYLIKNK